MEVNSVVNDIARLLEKIQSERLQTNWIGSPGLAVGTQPIPYRQACIVPLLLELNRNPRSLFTGKGTKLLTGPRETGGPAQVVHIVKVDRGSAGFSISDCPGVRVLKGPPILIESAGSLGYSRSFNPDAEQSDN
jgi:hypothetical protein